MPVATAGEPKTPKQKRRPVGTERRQSGSMISAQYNDADWPVQLLRNRHRLSVPYARVIASILFGEEADA